MGVTITVQELKEKLERGEKIVLIDVRELWEYNICKIPNAQLIPLGTLGTEYKKLDPNAEIVLHCHMGMRSMDATQFLLQQGLDRKSTRLNSSHRCISYAVFCLK